MDETGADPRRSFEWPVRVYHEDTDGLGVVYHAGYLRFMERARTEWLRAAGIEQGPLRDEHGVLFVVAHLEIDYLAPARYGDLLAVDVALEALGGASLRLTQHVRRGPDELLCRATVRIGCVGARTLAPAAIPTHLIPELKR